MPKAPFKQQVHAAREAAIVDAVNRLLAEKGYDAMTVDQVAADVGIAKASLYKHFDSKEALAAAAMVRALDRALARVAMLSADTAAPAIVHLKAMVRWTLQVQLAGDMPALPAQNSSLRTALMGHAGYVDRLSCLSDALGAWITSAQRAGALRPALPPEVVLYTLFARACDPVPGLLKAGGNHADAEIVEMLVAICFDGVSGASPAPATQRAAAAITDARAAVAIGG